eukprot:gene2276-2419_t
MFAQDLVESDEAFDILIDEVLGENDFSETSSVTEPSLDPDPVIGRQYLAVPDIVFQLSDVKVCQRLNTPGSKIVATSMVRGTMLYSIVPTQRSIQDNDQKLSSEKEDNTMFSRSSKHDDHVLLQLLDEQLDYCMEGLVTISLDDQHRFISISIEAEKVECQSYL